MIRQVAQNMHIFYIHLICTGTKTDYAKKEDAVKFYIHLICTGTKTGSVQNPHAPDFTFT